MAKHLSSRGLTNRLSLTRWAARVGPKTFQTPLFWSRIRDPRESPCLSMQFIRKQ
jgi:hypothetical protein